MVVLYGSRGSGSAAIEAALALLGKPVRIVEAATWVPGPGLDELRTVNPLGQIPTLALADGTVLALLTRIEDDARVAAVFARHWPPAA